MEIFEFSAAIQDAVDEGTGRLTARIVPYGEAVPYGAGTVRFEQGGLQLPASVPLTIDHGESVLDRIGVLERFTETDTGAFAEFTISDTPNGQIVRTLLADGALADVSIGVSEFTVTHSKDQVMSGTLDHVSIVAHGRFPSAEVLSVHSTERPPMADETPEVTPEVAEYDDSEIKTKLAEFESQLVDIADAVSSESIEAPADIDPIKLFTDAVGGAMDTRAEFALADVIGDLGAADASGISPDYYWAGGIQQIVDPRRPLFAASGSAQFPEYGNNLNTARVTQQVAVASGTAQKAEVASQALQAIEATYPVVWHKGAVDVAMELISQSSPDVRGVLANSFLHVYAAAVNADAATKVQALATHTGAALDTSTYGALVADLITTGGLIRTGTGSFGNMIAVTTAEWIAINSLLDGDGRRAFAPLGATNADGTSNLTSYSVNIAGVNVFEDPDVATAIQFNQQTYRGAEKAPQRIEAVNVANAGIDMGIIGATVNVVWPAGVYSYEI